MASTQTMMLRARKAKAQHAKFRIDEKIFLDCLLALSHKLVELNPEQDYAQTDNTLFAAKHMIEKDKLTRTDLEQIIKFRETFEQALTKKYGVTLSLGLSAFTQNQEDALKSQAVPQHLRVLSGLLDTLIATLAFRTGTIKFHNMKLG